MFKVLIVDDEPIHRRGLTNMINRLRPEYSVADAKNGFEAIEYLNRNQIDLIITDIQMPIMNGLELIENLVESGNKTKIVILSVYGYFDYAKRAIALGAIDYILKPVDEVTVEEVLKKVEKIILQQLEEKQEKENLKLQLNAILPDCLTYKMNKLIYGLLNSYEYEEIRSNFPCRSNGTVIVFELDNKDLLGGFNMNKETKSNISIKINSELNVFGAATSFFLQDETNSIVSIVDTNFSRNLMYDESISRFNEIINDINNKYGLMVTVGIGSKYENFFNEVKNSFKHAKKALECKFFTGYGKIIFYDEVNVNQNYQSIVSDKKENLTNAILKFDKEYTKQLIDDFFIAILKDGYPKIEKFISCISGFLENLIKSIDNKLNTSYFKKLKVDINENLFECNNFETLKSMVYQILLDLINILVEQKNNKNNDIIEMCKKYIEEHYMEDISLDSVARLFYFNPSYFSNLFKGHTDTNFCEYLHKTRMDNAKIILQTTSYKVYEISNMVGYQDPKYFNRLFKKEFALTPDGYRRIIGTRRLGD